jgi:hypothetical protein
MNSAGIEVKGKGVWVNQSRLQDFLDCEVYYHLNYEYRPKEEYDAGGIRMRAMQLPLEFGTAYHEAVGEYYATKRNVDAAIAKGVKLLLTSQKLALPIGDEVKTWDNHVLLLPQMIRAYDVKYHNEPIQVLATEVHGDVQLGSSPHHLVFRTDALVQQYNQVGLLDHKTRGRAPTWMDTGRIHMGIQPTAYMYGVLKSTNFNVSGMWIRMAIKKPKLGPAEMHVEEWTTRNKADLQRFEDQAITVCERILELRRTGKWLHNFNHCIAYGECRMRPMCLHHNDDIVLGKYEPRKADYVNDADACRSGSNKTEGANP